MAARTRQRIRPAQATGHSVNPSGLHRQRNFCVFASARALSFLHDFRALSGLRRARRVPKASGLRLIAP
jgi:hypothetical protein